MRPLATATVTAAALLALAGCSADEDAMALTEAVDLALADAGVAEADATVVDKHSYEDDGSAVHGVTFLTADARYRYEIDAATGDILGAHVDARDDDAGATSGADAQPTDAARVQPELTPTEALEAALAEAGVTRDEARDWDTDLEYDSTAPFYEVSFEAGTLEHEVWVDAVSGEILQSWSERD
ncbi:PepSY domain-containing protein [Demequina sp. NBRC 110057]|uniref:PepSY domain-containing protein n=1 Tax=Demequina sp. NBRC 110057 TaxID=1570346 RepID=UPI000A01DB03|nr:PepSY domain-containing protein [Demequina sp. NBRC 110057]